MILWKYLVPKNDVMICVLSPWRARNNAGLVFKENLILAAIPQMAIEHQGAILFDGISYLSFRILYQMIFSAFCQKWHLKFLMRLSWMGGAEHCCLFVSLVSVDQLHYKNL